MLLTASQNEGFLVIVIAIADIYALIFMQGYINLPFKTDSEYQRGDSKRQAEDTFLSFTNRNL